MIDLSNLPTYDPDHEHPFCMELRAKYNDGDYYKVDDVKAALARATPQHSVTEQGERVPGIAHLTTYADLVRLTPLQLWNRWRPEGSAPDARSAFIAARNIPFAQPLPSTAATQPEHVDSVETTITVRDQFGFLGGENEHRMGEFRQAFRAALAIPVSTVAGEQHAGAAPKDWKMMDATTEVWDRCSLTNELRALDALQTMETQLGEAYRATTAAGWNEGIEAAANMAEEMNSHGEFIAQAIRGLKRATTAAGQQGSAHAQLERAERALRRAGFEDLGGEEWKPPIGHPPRFIEVATPPEHAPVDTARIDANGAFTFPLNDNAGQ